MSATKDTYYFSHDANALSDPKILAMRCDYGFESYGLYWAIIEMLRNEAEYKLPLDRTTFRAIKMQTSTNIDIEKYLNDCINEYKDSETGNGLFKTDGKYFWSASLLRRMEKYEQIKKKRSDAANARWGNRENRSENNKKMQKKCKNIKNKCKSNANAYKRKCKSNAKLKKVYAKLCKLNQIKLNEIKLNKIKSIYPSYHPFEMKKEIENYNKMMDEMDKIEFEKITQQSKVKLYSENLSDEIINVMQEIYLNPATKEKLKKIKLQHIDYALNSFAKANAKSTIQMPKRYFKKCLLTALDELELSKQFNLNFD